MTVSGTKLSQIATAPAPPASTDFVVGIGPGPTDYRYTLAQIATIVSSLGAAPPLHAVQFNNPLGTFAGDANLVWLPGLLINSNDAAVTPPVASFDGMVNYAHSAFGHYGAINNPTFAPGDPTNAATYPAGTYTSPLISNEFFTGDLSAFSAGGISTVTAYSGLRHTGASSAAFAGAIDAEVTVNSNSTGPFGGVDAITSIAFNYGSGNISEFDAVTGIADHRGTGTVTDVRGFNSQARLRTGATATNLTGLLALALQFGGTSGSVTGLTCGANASSGVVSNLSGLFVGSPNGGATITNCYNLAVGDASGVSTLNGPGINIYSAGTNSNNFFDGQISIGKNNPFAWSSTTLASGTKDTFLYRGEAAGIVELYGGASFNSPTIFRLYNTYTSSSNYERGVFDWQTTSNVLQIGTEKLGTGTARNVAIIAGGSQAVLIDTGLHVTQGGFSNISLDSSASSFQVSSSSGDWTLSGIEYGNNGNSAGFAFAKTRGASPLVQGALVGGDSVGGMSALGSDGTSFHYVGDISVRVDGTVSAGVVPGNITFQTADASTGVLTKRLILDSLGSFRPFANAGTALGDNTHRFSDLFLAGTVTYASNSPSTLASGSTNNYDPGTDGYFQRLTANAANSTLTGFAPASAGQKDGQRSTILNLGTGTLTLSHQNGGSTATNQFLNSTGADIVLSTNQTADLIYDNTTQRWRVYKRN